MDIHEQPIREEAVTIKASFDIKATIQVLIEKKKKKKNREGMNEFSNHHTFIISFLCRMTMDIIIVWSSINMDPIGMSSRSNGKVSLYFFDINKKRMKYYMFLIRIFCFLSSLLFHYYH